MSSNRSETVDLIEKASENFRIMKEMNLPDGGMEAFAAAREHCLGIEDTREEMKCEINTLGDWINKGKIDELYVKSKNNSQTR